MDPGSRMEYEIRSGCTLKVRCAVGGPMHWRVGQEGEILEGFFATRRGGLTRLWHWSGIQARSSRLKEYEANSPGCVREDGYSVGLNFELGYAGQLLTED